MFMRKLEYVTTRPSDDDFKNVLIGIVNNWRLLTHDTIKELSDPI